ncbi:arsenate reductase ArsC [Deinococcus roseus]|uniref:Arsenate reductase n=1 Tax=Deinococcus roseus TaxID=392414 RepID=A0ABQ2D9U8_9DEIO|nr:arsenate reductase ArsC [Deinococcus roseus]GGJ47057.1 arsenate reductase [Deinococcus roseus]
MTRILILCTHNSARSQMGEGLLRHLAQKHGLQAEVHSAGTEATFVKEGAKQAMQDIGIDLSSHTSKKLFDLPDPWNFDYVITVCDSAAEACPVYPASTIRLHYPFTDPSGGSQDRWNTVRDQMKVQLEKFVVALSKNLDVPESYEQSPTVALS